MLEHLTEDILRNEQSKELIVEVARHEIGNREYTIVDEAPNKPWGAYFRFSEEDLHSFLGHFYQGDGYTPQEGMSQSPKILLMAPDGRLSWQWHHRRSEVWKMVGGIARIITSDTDDENEGEVYRPPQIVEIAQGQRHTMEGVGQWGVVAEIWQHVDPSKPSIEEDIVRISDKYGREGTTENR